MRSETLLWTLNHAPDGYMWSLLKLARAVDKCFVQRGPLVGQCFNSAEYKEAKKVISALVKHAEDDRTEAALQEDDKDPWRLQPNYTSCSVGASVHRVCYRVTRLLWFSCSSETSKTPFHFANIHETISNIYFSVTFRNNQWSNRHMHELDTNFMFHQSRIQTLKILVFKSETFLFVRKAE